MYGLPVPSPLANNFGNWHESTSSNRTSASSASEVEPKNIFLATEC